MLVQSQTGAKRERPRGTALVVEDSPTDRQLLVEMLERLGCRCDSASDGEEGIVAALSGAYDFVFMDIRMPRMNGWAATRFIHDKLGPRSPFIVAVTGLRSEQDRQRCVEAGADYILTKPVHRAVLEMLLED